MRKIQNILEVEITRVTVTGMAAEFPALVSLARRLGNRDFEMVTISMDREADAAALTAALQPL